MTEIVCAIMFTVFCLLGLICVALNAGMEDARGHFDMLLAVLAFGFFCGVFITIALVITL